MSIKIEDVEQYQSVYSNSGEINFQPGKNFSFDISYTTSNLNNKLSELALRVHYDSSIINPLEKNNGLESAINTISELITINDLENFDDNTDTDKYISIKWVNPDNDLLSENLPTKLGRLFFNASSDNIDPLTGNPETTLINFTAEPTSNNYDFLSSSTILKPSTFNLDVDGNGKVTALGDGLMIIRKLFGAAFSGEKLTANAITNSSTRTTEEIHDFITTMIEIPSPL